MSTSSVITRRLLVLGGIVLASLGTACTAIVAAQLSETNDYPIDGSVRGSSSSSGEPLDKCSLYAVDSFTSSSHFDPDASHPCLECIQTNCAADLAYACDGGTNPPGQTEWFRYMKDCAQEPAVRYGYSSWGCSRYDRDASITTGTSPAAHESSSQQCIKNNCLQGGTPACKTCPVYVDEPGSTSSRVPLEHSTCGQCLQGSCGAEIVKCCDSKVVSEHVTACAFTENGDLKTDCQDLRDGGISPPADPSEEIQCDYEIRHCYKTKCQGSCP